MRTAILRTAFTTSLPLSLRALRQPPLCTLRNRRRFAMSAAVATPAAVPSLAGVAPVMAQCMLRITSPSASRAFYESLGMKLLTRLDFADLKFSLFFYAYTSESPPDQAIAQAERAQWLWNRPYPTVELTWNWPADTFEESLDMADAGDKGDEEYVTGNEPPLGFGHLGIVVNDVDKCVAALGGKVVKAVDDGGMPGVAVADPDGYHVRFSGRGGEGEGVEGNDPVFGGVMLRVKDPKLAIPFFNRLGMRVVDRVDEEGRSEICMGYAKDEEKELVMRRECLVKLVHVWGTENEEEPYVNGNVKPYRGFGHVGITVNDIYETMSGLEAEGYKVVRKPGPFRDAGDIAFIGEPSTGYWVEIIQRSGSGPSQPYAQL